MSNQEDGESSIKKGKKDWMSYQNKLNQVQEDRVADKNRNEEIGAKKLAKVEAAEAAAKEERAKKAAAKPRPIIGPSGMNLG
jgi:hypothetical protein